MTNEIKASYMSHNLKVERTEEGNTSYVNVRLPDGNTVQITLPAGTPKSSHRDDHGAKPFNTFDYSGLGTKQIKKKDELQFEDYLEPVPPALPPENVVAARINAGSQSVTTQELPDGEYIKSVKWVLPAELQAVTYEVTP